MGSKHCDAQGTGRQVLVQGGRRLEDQPESTAHRAPECHAKGFGDLSLGVWSYRGFLHHNDYLSIIR